MVKKDNKKMIPKKVKNVSERNSKGKNLCHWNRLSWFAAVSYNQIRDPLRHQFEVIDGCEDSLHHAKHRGKAQAEEHEEE